MFAALRRLLSPQTSLTASAGQSHQRINEILLEYWEALRGGREMPSETEVNPSAIASIWDACYLVSTKPEMIRDGYKYNYLGTTLIELFGDDLTGQDVCAQLVNPTSPALVNKIREVVANRQPVMEESQFTNSRNMTIRYRSCMLPLSGKDGEVAYVMGGMKWKSF